MLNERFIRSGVIVPDEDIGVSVRSIFSCATRIVEYTLSNKEEVEVCDNLWINIEPENISLSGGLNSTRGYFVCGVVRAYRRVVCGSKLGAWCVVGAWGGSVAISIIRNISITRVGHPCIIVVRRGKISICSPGRAWPYACRVSVHIRIEVGVYFVEEECARPTVSPIRDAVRVGYWNTKNEHSRGGGGCLGRWVKKNKKKDDSQNCPLGCFYSLHSFVQGCLQ